MGREAMSRYECQRCHEVCFTTNPPHVCKDIRKRHERQAKAVELVVGVLAQYGLRQVDAREAIALDIIKALAGRDLGVG
jgi:hypothetical protein